LSLLKIAVIQQQQPQTNVYAGQRDRFDRPKLNLASAALDLVSGTAKPGLSYWDAIKKLCCEPPAGFNDQRKVRSSVLQI